MKIELELSYRVKLVLAGMISALVIVMQIQYGRYNGVSNIELFSSILVEYI